MQKHPGNILIAPRITEKASGLSEMGAYVFMVAPSADKQSIKDAVRAIYNVTPRKVTLVAIPRKQVMTRGTNRTGRTAGGKKAYVFLKKGDKIDLA